MDAGDPNTCPHTCMESTVSKPGININVMCMSSSSSFYPLDDLYEHHYNENAKHYCINNSKLFCNEY